ncbi:DeoR family transcriptional regulator [Pasteurella skyensis]|uniref:DeoR family transcriptional regulator n=1 Tax=Phocoenobacter skyensis TaxID=97481 RepID=A0AAJ6NCR2_9PAST|nr:DeoR family transcriptional regulator [Pasteurella skyensis]MDP8170301.1 DeoR family transcriptional regulator [Pasteurella skyensis]MDP8174398.1 DeoR family transcriptional regulator [Pasteurella skyensis]MDP8177569.1 DeoR family transcriptional regulator [Pasteurella skyensis]MDP8200165.1 DeoR family transcriptional regulator [Pasteurella skyensis]
MSKRNTQQRRHLIATLVQEQGEVSVEELSELFETSEVTIRKDLTILEESGVLLRRYGGAIRIPSEFIDDQHIEYISKQKKAIAKLAVSCIRDHNRFIIDSGSTTGALIPHLTQTGLVIMTNSLALASELTALEIEPTVLMTGGTWDARSDSFQGKVAETALRSYDFDQLFIGADGLDLTRGTTTFNELVGLSQVMAEVSREVNVMIESQKMDRKMPNVELVWDQIDRVITDNQIDVQVKKELEQKGIEVLVAQV